MAAHDPRTAVFPDLRVTTATPPAKPAKTAAAKPVSHPAGRLEWRRLLRWLHEDGIISSASHEQTANRFAAGDSIQHPLVRLSNAQLLHAKTGKPLDVEMLTEWLAGRVGLPYVRIDPLKVDVGRVADVMSITYAERRRALPLQFGLNDVTVATSEPFDLAWVPEIEAHTRKALKIVVSNPIDVARFTTEF